MIAAIAWDIDGTLVDSEPLHLRALQQASAAYGVDLSDLPDDQFLGVGMDMVWKALRDRYPAALEQARWLRDIQRRYAIEASMLKPMPGATHAICELARIGMRQVAVSNSGRKVVDVNLDAIGVAEYLEFSLSIDDVAVGKPDPRPYLDACARLALPAHSVLAVEDSLTGARSAYAAGLKVAFLGEAPPPFPVVRIHAPSDILSLIVG